MNRIKLIISTIIIIGGIFPFISFGVNETAEPCLACGSSPANLSLINSFTTEILSNIKTIGTADPYAGKHVPPSWFDSGKFVAPKQSIVSKTLRRARESLGSVLAIKRINLNVGNLVNIGDSLGVLASNHTILRDRQKVSKIEQDINKKKYELSVGGGRTDKIGGVTLERMKSIIKRYEDLGILNTATSIDPGAEYGDLIFLLGKLNSSLKSLVAFGGAAGADAENEPSFDLRISGKVAIKIEGIDEIKSAYECTRRYACEQSRTSVLDERKKAMESFKDGLGTANEQRLIANEKLKQAYSKENLKKTFRTENTIVTQLSGTLNNIKKRRDRTIETLKENKEARQDRKEIKKNEDDETKQTENNQTIADSFSTTTTIDNQKIINDFKAKILNTQNKIEGEANIMINKYQTIEIPDIMTYFVAISQKINGINEKIIGSKDGDSCLIKNLGALCEKQCSNIGNKSCYY